MRDKDIRAALRRTELAPFLDDPESRVVEELGILQGDFRIDIAAVNGALHGWEIKSERDTLVRLPAQAEAYGSVFDFVTLVASPAHLENAITFIPEVWGLCLASGSSCSVSLQPIRPAQQNPSVDITAVVQLLWKEEAVALLDKYGGARGLRSSSRRVAWQALTERLDPDCLKTEVRRVLKQRLTWRSES